MNSHSFDLTLLIYLQARTPRELVAGYLDQHRVRVTADGNPERTRKLDTFESRISRRPIDEKILRDEIVEVCRAIGRRFAQADIMRAIRLELLERADRRRDEILRPLIEVVLSEDELQRADQEFRRMAQLFEMPASLSIACVRQFMWLFKRKQTRRVADHPIMLVIYSPVQGAGKSWFSECMIKPLQELASDGIPFSEIADPRSTGLQKNGVAYIDDAGGVIPRKTLGSLKAAITLPSSKRRDLGKSRQSRHEHDAVFIATTNESLHRMIPDDTGHRRFAVLPFKNGAVEKGGDPELRNIVNSLDFELLWKSVSVHDEAPIAPVLAELHVFQLGYIPPDLFTLWLEAFDFESEGARNVTSPRGIGAKDFYDLYRQQTGDDRTDTALGRAIKQRMERGGLPMVKKRVGAGYFFSQKIPRDDR